MEIEKKQNKTFTTLVNKEIQIKITTLYCKKIFLKRKKNGYIKNGYIKPGFTFFSLFVVC